MRRVALGEARRRFGELVRAVEAGETVILTRRGREVARIVPVESAKGRALRGLTKLGATLRGGGRSMTEDLLEMRREERS